MTIEVSERAAFKAKQIQADNPQYQGKCIRVAVKGGGCAGFMYDLSFDEEQPHDIVIEKDGVRFLIDPYSIMFLPNAKIDYVELLTGAGFKIDNPNAVSSCGCGHSFSAE